VGRQPLGELVDDLIADIERHASSIWQLDFATRKAYFFSSDQFVA